LHLAILHLLECQLAILRLFCANFLPIAMTIDYKICTKNPSDSAALPLLATLANLLAYSVDYQALASSNGKYGLNLRRFLC